MKALIPFAIDLGGDVTLKGTGTINLSAPTAGTYAGILMFQSPSNPRAMQIDRCTPEPGWLMRLIGQVRACIGPSPERKRGRLP